MSAFTQFPAVRCRRPYTTGGALWASRAICVLAFLAGPAVLRAQDAAELRKNVKPVISLSADYSYVGFEDGLDPWHYASLALGRRGAGGSIIGRVNYAHRFGSSGGQVEVDAYPRLSKNTYAYLSAGYSPSSIFPTWRSGGELFIALPKAWETSVGYRQLRFDGVPVTLFTGALGKYVGNYWFSLRPFVRQKDTGMSGSASITARRYFEDGDHFIGARIGYGSTPPDQGAPDSVSLARQHSFAATVQGSGGLRAGLLGTWSLSYDREELDRSRLRKSWTAAAGLRFVF